MVGPAACIKFANNGGQPGSKNPEKGQNIVWDTKLNGFGVRLTKSAKTYVCESRVKGRTRRVSIAPFSTLTVAQVRKEAQRCLGQMATDVDPNAEKAKARAKGITLEEAKSKFLKNRNCVTRLGTTMNVFSSRISRVGTSEHDKTLRPKCS